MKLIGPGVVGHVSAGGGGVPVVRVHDLGRPLWIGVVGRQVRRRPAEQREALQVVGPLLALAVLVRTAAAAVEVRRVDQVDRQLRARHAAEQQAVDDGACALHRIEHRRQAGQQHAHVGALLGQRHRQRRHHVGQAAGLDEREDFGGDVQDLHRRPPDAYVSLRSMSRVTSVMPDSVR
jgi:hypothetical protein